MQQAENQLSPQQCQLRHIAHKTTSPKDWKLCCETKTMKIINSKAAPAVSKDVQQLPRETKTMRAIKNKAPRQDNLLTTSFLLQKRNLKIEKKNGNTKRQFTYITPIKPRQLQHQILIFCKNICCNGILLLLCVGFFFAVRVHVPRPY